MPDMNAAPPMSAQPVRVKKSLRVDAMTFPFCEQPAMSNKQ
jgi:hypothetical protein